MRLQARVRYIRFISCQYFFVQTISILVVTKKKNQQTKKTELAGLFVNKMCEITVRPGNTEHPNNQRTPRLLRSDNKNETFF